MDDSGGQDGLQAIFEARRRIVAAFEGIVAGSEAMAIRAAAAPDADEVERLRAEIEEQVAASADLAQQVLAFRAAEAEHGERLAGLEGELAAASDRIAELEAREAAQRAEIDAVLAGLLPILEGAA